jgi:hypothetical protein
MPIYYTLEDAQRTLEEVKPKIAEMVELKEACDRKGYDVYKHQYLGGMGPNGQKVFPPEMEKLALIFKQLEDLGIEVKDIGKGLIDFWHKRRTGEDVYLCYLHGEEGIAYWHTISGGFSGRRPLMEL